MNVLFLFYILVSNYQYLGTRYLEYEIKMNFKTSNIDCDDFEGAHRPRAACTSPFQTRPPSFLRVILSTEK